MKKTPTEVIETYVEMASKVVIPHMRYSYVDADIINRKITRALLGLSLTKETNLDTITYDTRGDTTLTNSLFQLFELYIRTDIRKMTGITYTEFKELSMIEKELLLEYVGFKVDVTDIDATTISDELSDPNAALYNF